MSWWGRLVHRKRLEGQLRAELEYHLERQAADNLRAGMTEEEARRNAALQFGGVEQIREDCRDARGTRGVEATYQDIRFAWRMLRKSPGFAAAAVCTLALGIGANTAIFSVINGVILRPLPYREPGRLVALEEQSQTLGRRIAFSYLDFLDCKRASQSLEGIAAYRDYGVNVTSPGEAEYLHAQEISAGFLSTLGIKLFLGREFNSEEDRRGAAPVAMIGYSLWQERFAGSGNAIGARLVASGKGYTIVGILPADFHFFLEEGQVLTPIGQDDTIAMQNRDFHSGGYAIARLKLGVTIGRANSELKAIGRRLAREYPDTNRNMTFGTEPLKQEVVGDIGSTLFLLAGAVALVLLIACANVANLFLARSLSRSREFAIRAALGAGRVRLIRQLLTESVLLSVAGGSVGLGIAGGATHWALKKLPFWVPRTDEISLDTPVLVFTLLAAVLTGIAFGIAPALRQQLDMGSVLRQGARGSSRGIGRLQGNFVIAELALALVLLTGAGLMMRTILRLWAVNPGFDPSHVLVMTVGLSPKAVSNPTLLRTAWKQILDRVRSTPGVEAATLDSLGPLSGDNQSVAYWATAETSAPKNAPFAWLYTPTPGYLQTMKIPLLRGRFFNEQDRVGTQPVVVIDETLAKRLSPGKDPVGSELSLQIVGRVRIVGVVGAIKHLALDEDAHGPPEPALYLPFLQFPDEFMSLTQSGMDLLVRTSMPPMSVVQAVKHSVWGPTRDQPVRDVVTMEQQIGASMGKRRGMLFLLSIFAGVALLLASVGIYGVISYSMNRRVQEIGIRMALGAQPAQVLRLVLRQAMRTVLTGVVTGAVVSLALAHLMTKLLYGVSPTDPLTLALVVVTLCSVAFAAIYVPARQAARIDPLLALKYE